MYIVFSEELLDEVVVLHEKLMSTCDLSMGDVGGCEAVGFSRSDGMESQIGFEVKLLPQPHRNTSVGGSRGVLHDAIGSLLLKGCS